MRRRRPASSPSRGAWCVFLFFFGPASLLLFVFPPRSRRGAGRSLTDRGRKWRWRRRFWSGRRRRRGSGWRRRRRCCRPASSVEPVLREPVRGRLPAGVADRPASPSRSGPEAADRGRPKARPPPPPPGASGPARSMSPRLDWRCVPAPSGAPARPPPGPRGGGAGGAGCAARRRPLPRRGGGFFAVSVSVSAFVFRPGPDAGTAAARATADASAGGPPPLQLVVQWLTARRPPGRATQGCSRGPGSWRGPGRCSCTCCT